MIAELAGCLSLAALAQLAGGLHDLGRQALSARLDDRSPRLASALALATVITLALASLLLPAGGPRLHGLVTAILAGEITAACPVLRRVRRAISPQRFTERRQVISWAGASAAMVPFVGIGRWALHHYQLPRLGELGALAGVAVLALGALLAVLRLSSPFTHADQPS